MKIYDEHGAHVGEIEKQGPVEKGGMWYEAVDVRPIPDGKGEWYVPLGGWSLQFSRFSRKPVWIMRPIPRATPEQLKAIGMKERDDRPVKCKEGETVWNGMGWFGMCKSGCYRWVLVPAEKEPAHPCVDSCSRIRDCPHFGYPENDCYEPPVAEVEKEPAHTGVCRQCGKPVVFGKDGCCNNGHELCFACWEQAGHTCPVCLARCPAPAPEPVKEKEPVHTSCEGCYWELNGHGSEERHHTCFTCHSLDNGSQEERKNYTPAPAPVPTELDCPVCQGKSSRLECPACGGSGKLPILDRGMLEGKTAPAPAHDVTLTGDLVCCPFCGSIEISHDGHVAVCDICKARGPEVFPTPSERKVFELWNRRHPNPPAQTAPKVVESNGCWNCGENWAKCDSSDGHAGCDKWKPKQPVPKVTEKGWSCSSCRHGTTTICDYVLNEFVDCCGENYERLITAPKITEALNRGAHLAMCKLRGVCLSLGMIPSPDKMIEDDMESFIRDLAQRAGEERYTVEEINRWLNGLPLNGYAKQHIDNPYDGIKAVTTRAGTRPERERNAI